MTEVNILMATYNGADYIEEQITSLIDQDYKNWSLIIHDDGSTDKTVSIINQFEEKDSRITLINDGIRCKGAAQNFLHLLKLSTADLIIFCDQDDVWLKNKLSSLVKLFAAETGPCAAYCEAYGYKDAKIIAKKVSFFDRTNLQDSLFLNGGIQGCSLMFNRALLKKVAEFPSYVFMHDHFLTIAAATFAKIKKSEEPLMLYRQHDNNVTGNVKISLVKRAFSFFNLNQPVLDSLHYAANQSFYDQYKNQMSDTNKCLFEAYLAYPYKNRWDRMRIILDNSFKIGRNRLLLLLKTAIRKPI